AGVGAPPGGVGALDPVGHHMVDSATGHQLLQYRRFHIGGGHVLPGARYVVHLAAALIEEPLSGGARRQELEGVLHLGRLFGDARPADEVVCAAVGEATGAGGGVAPARLGHGDLAAGDRRDRAARFGPGAEAAAVDELQLRLGAARVAPAGHRGAAAGVAGRVLPAQAVRQRTVRAVGAGAVDV